MTNGHFEYGVTVKLQAACTNIGGGAIDPATATFRIKNPVGVLTTYVYGTDAEIVKSATGIYSMNINCQRGGDWCWEFITTGPDGARQRRFAVESSYL